LIQFTYNICLITFKLLLQAPWPDLSPPPADGLCSWHNIADHPKIHRAPMAASLSKRTRRRTTRHNKIYVSCCNKRHNSD